MHRSKYLTLKCTHTYIYTYNRAYKSTVSPSDAWRLTLKGYGVQLQTLKEVNGAAMFGLSSKKVKHIFKKR
jgi:hypothetical protein